MPENEAGGDQGAQELELKVDLERLTIGDLEKLEKPSGTTEFIDVLQKAVVGTNIRALPLGSLRAISRAISREVQGLRDTKA